MKLFFAVFAFLFFVSAFAETKNVNGYTVHLKASKEGSLYKKGEPVDFVLRVSKDGKPADDIKCEGEITKDSILPKKISGKTSDGKFVATSVLNEAGFLRCRLRVYFPKDSASEASSVEMMAGAGFDVFEIEPSMPPPDDFKSFWDGQLAELAKVPLNIKLYPEKSEDESVSLFRIEADFIDGLMRGYLAYPSNAKEKTLPAVLCTHGAGVRSSRTISVMTWAKNGFIALDFNVHGILDGQSDEYYKELSEGKFKDYLAWGVDSKEKSYVRLIYLRAYRALEALTAQPQWNGKTLVVSGASQGGAQALALGYLSDKVALIAPVVAGMCDNTGYKVNRTVGGGRFAHQDGDRNKPISEIQGEASRYIDGVNFARFLKCGVVMTINFADPACPPTSQFAAYNIIKSKKVLFVGEEERHHVPLGYEDKALPKVLELAK